MSRLFDNDFIVSEIDYTKREGTNIPFYQTSMRPTKYNGIPHGYSCMAALGRIITALIQNDASTPFNGSWIERGFKILPLPSQDRIQPAITDTTLLGDDDSISIEEIHKGFMFLTLLSAWNWSEHWKYKTNRSNLKTSLVSGEMIG